MKPKYYVLVDNGHNEFAKWVAKDLKEARDIEETLRLEMLEHAEIVKVIK